MADHTSRPYGSTPNFRQGPAAPSGNDPLAELARLIGQTDPFGEYARDGRRGGVEHAAPPSVPHAAEQNHRYAPPPAYPQQSNQYDQGFAAESYPPGYDAQQQGFPHQSYPAHGYFDKSQQDTGDDVYDDLPPARRRIGIVAIAAVFALAVLGTAGAVGYRALFGTSGSTPPPVIKADTAPVKVVPPAPAEPASNKLITDRVSGPQGERVVSREEQPIDLRDRPPQAAFPGTPQPQAAMAMPVSGVVGTEPKKIRTIAIRPDQQGAPEAMPTPTPAAQSPSRAPAAAPAPRPAPAARNADADEAPAAPPQRQAAARPQAAPANAPMSLNPDAAPAARSAPMRTASAPPPAAAAPSPAGNGGYAVQVSSQRSEADAQASFRALQAKYPGQLGSRQATIRRADLGDKGTYYRAMVNVGSADEASQLCNALRAAGGQCLIQRN